jgi:dolichol-phosphate mannosyltransferase
LPAFFQHEIFKPTHQADRAGNRSAGDLARRQFCFRLEASGRFNEAALRMAALRRYARSPERTLHLLVLRSAFAISAIDFTAAQAIATFVAMTSNFFLNNLFTYRDQRLSGPALIRGLLSFYAICSVGALGNVGIATYIFATDHLWWVAGIAGAFVGSVWNYAVSSAFTWGRR